MDPFDLPNQFAPLVSDLLAASSVEDVKGRHPAYLQLTAELQSNTRLAADWVAHLFANWHSGFFQVELSEIIDTYLAEAENPAGAGDDARLAGLSRAAERVFDALDESDRGRTFIVPLQGAGLATVFIAVSYTTATHVQSNTWLGVGPTAEGLAYRLSAPGILRSAADLELVPRAARLAALESALRSQDG